MMSDACMRGERAFLRTLEVAQAGETEVMVAAVETVGWEGLAAREGTEGTEG
jgi:hypothetical protein